MKHTCLFLLIFGLVLPSSAQFVWPVNELQTILNVTFDGLNYIGYNASQVDPILLAAQLANLMQTDPVYFSNVNLTNLIQTILTSEITITVCGQGSYSAPGDTACTPCPAGTFSLISNASSAAACTQCGAGTYSSIVGASSSSVCVLCSPNQWSNTIGAMNQSVCRNCTSNAIATAGSTDPSQCSCAFGYFYEPETQTCGNCPPNSYCVGGNRIDCPMFSTSPAQSNDPRNCTCDPGYFMLNIGICWLCPPGFYCKNNEQFGCPVSSMSPAGASNLSQCACSNGYYSTEYANQQWQFQVNMSVCNCSVGLGRFCGAVESEFALDAQVGSTCALSTTGCAPTRLNLTQGYVQLYNPQSPYLAERYQTWLIRPNNGFEVISFTFTLFHVDSGSIVSLSDCTSELASSCLPISTPLLPSQAPAVPFTITATRGLLKIYWQSSKTPGNFYGWKASYASSTRSNCAAPTVTTAQGAVRSPLFVWDGDTFEVNSITGMLLSFRRDSLSAEDVSRKQITSYTAKFPETYFFVDTMSFAGSRSITIVTLPLQVRKWNVFIRFQGTNSYTLSGDIAGTKAPIYLSIGDKLVLTQINQTLGFELEIFQRHPTTNLYIAIPNSLTLQGQQSFVSVTWDTSQSQPGTYFFGRSPAVRGPNDIVGTLVLNGRSKGLSCQLCTPGQYCYQSNVFACPAYSTSPPQAMSINDCMCNPGYYTERANLIAYRRSQMMDTSGRHTCAVVGESKQLFCWGLNDKGQCGFNGGVSIKTLPVRAANLDDILMVSLGIDFTCVVFNATQQVKCFGGNVFGQLGQDSGITSSISLNVTAMSNINFGDNDPRVSKISCNTYTCCVIISFATSDSRSFGVRCWGAGHSGQLGVQLSSGNTVGLGTPSSSITMPFISDVNLGGEMPADVSVGGLHACALTIPGNIFCWGKNDFGQVGVGNTVLNYFTPQLALVSQNGPSVAVECNADVCCAILRTMELKCWGQGRNPTTQQPNGRLGTVGAINVCADTSTCGINIPSVALGNGGLAVDVSIGDSQTCALLENNRVKCWGLVEGQVIGDQPQLEMNEYLPNILFNDYRLAIQIAGKGGVQCAILNSYQLSCWGDNSNWQLGVQVINQTFRAANHQNISSMSEVVLPDLIVKASGQALEKTCSLCPTGFYCSGMDAGNAIAACIPNSSSAPGSMIQEACVCLDGYYKDVMTGLCVLCQPGFYCYSGLRLQCTTNAWSLPGAKSLSDCRCAPGYAGSVTAGCTKCDQGLYKDRTADEACQLCPSGTYANQLGSSSLNECLTCPGGTFSGNGSKQCQVCLAGTFSNPRSSECETCSSGSYSTNNASMCTLCPAGSFQIPDVPRDDRSCSVCPTGTFSTIIGAANNTCQTCADGSFSIPGSRNCTLCPKGFWSVQGSVCAPCPTNSSSVGGTGPAGCACDPGFYRDMIGYVGFPGFSCKLCGPGTYSDGGNECKQCPAGTFTTGIGGRNSAACFGCSPGFYSSNGSAQCLGCNKGTFSSITGATACTNCEVGWYARANSSRCDACLVGTYGEGQIGSQAECTQCPIGFYCTGAKGRTLCPIGTYQGLPGQFSATACKPCKENSFCPMPYLQQSCPAGTVSAAGAKSMLECRCGAGVGCSYRKVVEAVVSLNATAAFFGMESVQQLFINAVAAAAQVQRDRVFLSKIVNKDTGEIVPIVRTTVRRRHLLETSGQRRPLKPKQNTQTFHVMLAVLDTDHMHDLNPHLEEHGLPKSHEFVWYAPHHVQVRDEGLSL